MFMTPYEMLLHEKEAVRCTNCEHLFQDSKVNPVEDSDHINYCKKSGKIILEMHVNTENIFKECFERKGSTLTKIIEESEREKK